MRRKIKQVHRQTVHTVTQTIQTPIRRPSYSWKAARKKKETLPRARAACRTILKGKE